MSGDRVRVLHFSNSLARGGAEEHILTLLRGLNRARFELHLVCTPVVAELIAKDVPDDVEVLPLSFYKPRQAMTGFALSRILRQRGIQVVHSHLFYASLFASPVAWASGVPAIIETPHVREQWRQGWLKSRFFIDRWAGRCVSRYIAVSEANKRYLVEEKRLPAEKIQVIHNGSDLRRFQANQQAAGSLRARLGLAAAAPVLLVAGRLEPQKGHRILLQALPAIRGKYPNVSVIFAGEGALEAELQAQTRALKAESCVRFVGFQRDVQDWFALADITVLPSFFEGLPLVAVESLAMGTPLVATDVDGTPEIVIHEKTGLTVPPGDADGLAQAICRLLGSRELRTQYGEAGRRMVHRHFSQERQIRETEQLYLEVLGMPTEPVAVHEHDPLVEEDGQLAGRVLSRC